MLILALLTIIVLGGGYLLFAEGSNQDDTFMIDESPDLRYGELPRDYITIADDHLNVTIRHGGGCPDRPPHLATYWTGEAQQKDNTRYQINLSLVHTDYDYCEAFISSKHRIDLDQIKESIADSEQIAADDIEIFIGQIRVSIRQG